MVEYKATLTLVPAFAPRRTENFPGNYPSSAEAEILDEAEELARVKQIKEDTRELVFTPEKSTFQIGRASSNPSKGLMAARDNAFFLSPVMSRYHAELQMIEKKIRIRDTDSMHGTYVNGKAIWGQEWQTLNSGDALTFGAQVTREGEVFMPKDFTCDVTWERIEMSPTTSVAASNKSDRRISGYGVSSEDLVISDDDTESVDFDKEYGYSEEDEEEEDEEYSDDSEQGDSDYEKENTDTMAVEDNFPISSVRDEEPKYGIKAKEQLTADSTSPSVRLPSVKSLVPETTPARGKFSIGSLMNDTLEALCSKRRVEGDDVQMTNTGNEGQVKGDKEDGPYKPPIDDNNANSQKIQTTVPGESTTSSSTASKNNTTTKPAAPTLFIEVDSESDSDEEPEELDAKGYAPWKHLSTPPTPPRETTKSSEKPPCNQPTNAPAPVKPQVQTVALSAPQSGPTTKSYSTNAVKPSDVFEAGKVVEDWPKLVPALGPTPSSVCGRRRIPSPPPKDEFFAAMRDNQNTLVSMMQERYGRITQGFPQAPTHETSDGLHSPPLPWVHSSFAPTHLTSSPQPNIPKVSNVQATSSASYSTPQNARRPHLFEQLLLSDEAKARTEKLEKLKAAIYNHRGKGDVSFNPWTIEDDEPLEGSPFGDEDVDMDLNEAVRDLLPPRSQPTVSVANPYLIHCAEKAKNRGFAISTLVDDQPTTGNCLKSVPTPRHWLAEKVSENQKDSNGDIKMTEEAPLVQASVSIGSVKPHEVLSHISPPHGTKRKYDDAVYEDMIEDKIVQEPAPIEEKIAELSVEPPIPNVDLEMEGVSEEKETYEEAIPVASAIVKEVTSKAMQAGELHRPADLQQPPQKRARIFTTGFALGAVTGAVGLFAALVASAP